ncbi:transcriptional regulator, partial [Acinetobacter baumannii]
FENEARFTSGDTSISTTFKPIYIFSGISTHAKLLTEGKDYIVKNAGETFVIELTEKHSLLDVYSEALWAERFTPDVMEARRKECQTLGEWDSQYQIHNQAIGDIRLDPDRLVSYSEEVTFNQANKETLMLLGDK